MSEERYKQNKEILRDVKAEIRRFEKRLNIAINDNLEYNARNIASVKRGALDLKNELTRITL